MIHSFRLRLAILSAVLSALILGAFSTAAWWTIRDLKFEQIGRELRAQSEREVNRHRSPEEWRRIEGNLAAAFGVSDSTRLCLLVTDADTVSYRSPSWPSGLGEATLPWLLPSRDIAPPPPAGPEAPGPPPQATEARWSAGGGSVWLMGLAAAGRTRVVIGVDSAIVSDDLVEVAKAFLSALPIGVLLAGAGAWVFAVQALRPVRNLTETVRRVSAAHLDERIALQGEPKELAALIAVFNAMLDRLERSFHQARRFSSDAAHEVKTPLAILQGQLERAIAETEAGSPMQAQLSQILDEVQRLASISRKLLLLSQADAGRLAMHFRAVQPEPGLGRSGQRHADAGART